MSDELIGQLLGQYLITSVIARGGMATVYKAMQTSLDRVVAIKVLRHDADPQFVARFRREARATATLQHHNILQIHDYNDQNGLLYLVLQYVEDGRTLGSMLGRPMATLAALQLMGHVLDALDYAHKRGIIHRDIKPSNILMPSATWPMLADFGIAKLMNDTQLQLTLSNQVIGTAIYLAPEQAMGKSVDARTDLYSAGVVLYELLTGQVPFDGDTPMEVWSKHVYEAPPSPRRLNPELPPALETLLLRALAKKPDERYQSISEMAAEMERVAHVLTLSQSRSQITNLYQGGIQAFEQGQWDEAVDQFGKLVALAPGYEDANELLKAARESLERARAEAHQRMELVRQRHQGAIQQQIGSANEPSMVAPAADPATGSQMPDAIPPLSPASTTAQTPALEIGVPKTDATMISPATSLPPPSAPTTGKLSALNESPFATQSLEEPEHAVLEAPVAGTRPLLAEASTNSAVPAAPSGTDGRHLPLARILAGVAALVVLVLFYMLRGGGQPITNDPATHVAQTTLVSTPTAGGAGVIQAAADVSTIVAPATATLAGPPPQPAGTLIYTDSFIDNKSGMENQPNRSDFERGIYAPGVYFLRLLNPNETRVELFAHQAYQNFSAQVDLNDNSDDLSGSAAQGLVFRAHDRQHYYALLIDPRAGKYRVIRQDGADKATELIPWAASPLINQQKDMNKLRVDAAATAFTIYLNDARLNSFDDKVYARGMIGFAVANVDAPKPQMHFDNLAIWTSDGPPQASGIDPVRKSDKGDMVLIPGGEFILGGNINSDEPPQMLQLPDFYIDRAEVTNALYRQCVAAKACTPIQDTRSHSHPDYANQPQYDAFPAINVSWQQASAFCGWAGKRLPTEAEWEKAASWKSAINAKFDWPWSNIFDPKRLNSEESKIEDTTEVGKFPSELNGTVDMAGNVSEWTSSVFLPYPYNDAQDRENPKSSKDRVYRGGSWAQTQGKARTIMRQPAPPEAAFNELGFRCAKTP